MEEYNPGRRTFSVGLKSAGRLLHCLMLMTGVSPTAVLTVRNGNIQILSSSADEDIHASVEMEASAASSWGFDLFAIQFHLSVWIDLLKPSIFDQETESLWIYKIGVYPDLYCLVGNDSVPIRLGETEFVGAKKSTDTKYLCSLASHPVKIRMQSQCFREVISSLALSYEHVGLMVTSDRVSWHTVGREFTYDAEEGDCLIEGVEKGTGRYMVVKWRGPCVLYLAAAYAAEVCMSCCLVDRDWMGWIRFSCLLDGDLPFLYLTRGSSNQVYL